MNRQRRIEQLFKQAYPASLSLDLHGTLRFGKNSYLLEYLEKLCKTCGAAPSDSVIVKESIYCNSLPYSNEMGLNETPSIVISPSNLLSVNWHIIFVSINATSTTVNLLIEPYIQISVNLSTKLYNRIYINFAIIQYLKKYLLQ